MGAGESVVTFETDPPWKEKNKNINFFFKSLPRSVIIGKARADPPEEWVASGLVITGSWLTAVKSSALKKS